MKEYNLKPNYKSKVCMICVMGIHSKVFIPDNGLMCTKCGKILKRIEKVGVSKEDKKVHKA